MRVAKGDDGSCFGLGDAEHPGEFAFKVKEGALCSGFLVEVSECAVEEVVEVRCRVVVLRREFQQFDKIGGECKAWIFSTQAIAGVAEEGFTKAVEFVFRTACKGNFAIVE